MSSKSPHRPAVFRTSAVRGTLSCLAIAALLCLAAASAAAEELVTKDCDLEIRVDKAGYVKGDTVQSFAGVVARKAGIEGWSFGVRHDPSVLEILSATSAGTDVASVFNGGFDETRILTDTEGVKIGYFQAVILAFVVETEVPVSDFFRMVDARYTVKDACDGKGGDFSTQLEFTDELRLSPSSPKIDINLTIGGKGYTPETMVDGAPRIQCALEPAAKDLFFRFDKTDTELVADQTEVYELKVLFVNLSQSETQDIEGWSYGVTLDTAELQVLSGQPGVDSKALNGGQGPDYVHYTLDDRNVSGSLKGVTVGGVVAMKAPGTEVLRIPAGGLKHVDTIRLRSKTTIPAGGASRTTVIGFSDTLGNDRPVDVVATIGGDNVIPDFTDKLTLTLVGPGVGKPRFIRGDANNDARVDVSDGVWIINWLFYSAAETVCKAAADANGDGNRTLTDAVYIFNYQLQPGATPSNLFPAPPAPFPQCGSVDNVTEQDCPMGSTTCM